MSFEIMVRQVIFLFWQIDIGEVADICPGCGEPFCPH